MKRRFHTDGSVLEPGYDNVVLWRVNMPNVSLRRLAAPILLISSALAQTPQAKQAPEVPYLPTTQVAVEAMLKLAGVTDKDVVYDLGCGDGRIVVTAAKLYGAHGVGIDIDPQRIREANENAKKAGVERLVRFEENDLFKANIRERSEERRVGKECRA